ncbi:RTA1-domain-containing protein [Auricularia subglabra TFB-10046 SS5]|nr:RTA1-domain-containing protein [Auricularia subglabra TFB-10046 SS5]
MVVSLSELVAGGSSAAQSSTAEHDAFTLLGYLPNDALTATAHGVLLLVALIQLHLVWKYKTWWLLLLPISAWTFTEGFAMRLVLRRKEDSLPVFIAQSTLIVLSPCAFLAADYLLLGRLAHFLGTEKHLVVAPKRITKIFLFSDLATFLIQGSGSGLMVMESSRDIGNKIFLGGLILQGISFAFFSAVFGIWLYRTRKFERITWIQDISKPWHKDWRSLAGALVVSCIGIIIRSIYRIVEGSEGFFGKLGRTEWIFYTFDALPLFIAIGVYIPFWPGRFIRGADRAQLEAAKDRHELIRIHSGTRRDALEVRPSAQCELHAGRGKQGNDRCISCELAGQA